MPKEIRNNQKYQKQTGSSVRMKHTHFSCRYCARHCLNLDSKLQHEYSNHVSKGVYRCKEAECRDEKNEFCVLEDLSKHYQHCHGNLEMNLRDLRNLYDQELRKFNEDKRVYIKNQTEKVSLNFKKWDSKRKNVMNLNDHSRRIRHNEQTRNHSYCKN